MCDTNQHRRQVRFITFDTPVEYRAMAARQEAAREALAAGAGCSTVFLLEHAPVITLGRRARREHVLLDADGLARLGIQLVETDRGGDVTYHGPGQMVAYPVLDLNGWRPSVNWYLRALEETLIRLLEGYGLRGERVEGFTGVWVDGAKVAAIGVGVRHWITWHGVALNVNPDENHWRAIIPCGIKDKPVTSLSRLLGYGPSMAEVMARFREAFTAVFECEAAPDEP